jgi:hypothetical protein
MGNKRNEEAIGAWVCAAYEGKLKSGDIPPAFKHGCIMRAFDIWHESGDDLLQYRHAEKAVEEQIEKTLHFVFGYDSK